MPTTSIRPAASCWRTRPTLILDARVTIPLHFEGWAHFTQGAEQLRAAFAGNGVTDRLRLPERGVTLWA